MANRLLANWPKPVLGLDGLLGSVIGALSSCRVDPAVIHHASGLMYRPVGRVGTSAIGSHAVMAPPVQVAPPARTPDPAEYRVPGLERRGGWAGSSPSPGVSGSCIGSGSSTGSVSSPGRNGVVAMKMVLFMLLPSIETLS